MGIVKRLSQNKNMKPFLQKLLFSTSEKKPYVPEYGKFSAKIDHDAKP